MRYQQNCWNIKDPAQYEHWQDSWSAAGKKNASQMTGEKESKLPKKGDISDCNWRGITLLSILLTNSVKPTSRCSRCNITRGAGWLLPRSIVHRTSFFTQRRNITEQCVELQRPLSNKLHRLQESNSKHSTVYNSLLNTARLCGILEHYVDIFRNWIPVVVLKPTLVSPNKYSSSSYYLYLPRMLITLSLLAELGNCRTSNQCQENESNADRRSRSTAANNSVGGQNVDDVKPFYLPLQ